MSGNDHGPSLWSHSTGEPTEADDHTASPRDGDARSSTNYSGVEDVASVAVVGKATTVALTTLSGETANERAKAKATDDDAEDAAVDDTASKLRNLALALSSGDNVKRDRDRRKARKAAGEEKDAGRDDANKGGAEESDFEEHDLE